eukprot:scaffold86320_cov34-Attheya_sp.AAC.1
MSTSETSAIIVITSPTTIGHTLAWLNEITGGTKNLSDLPNLDLSVAITMDTCTFGTFTAALRFGEVELRQTTTTQRTEGHLVP